MTDIRHTDVHGNGRGPHPLREPEASLGDLVARLTSETSGLLDDHLQLARIELMRDAKHAGRGAGLMGGAGVAGWIAALLLSLALAWGLAELLPTWVAFVIVGVLWAVGAAVMAMMGRRELRRLGPVAPETTEELQRDRQWFSRQTT